MAATSRNASRCFNERPSSTRTLRIPITAPRATSLRFSRSPRRSRSRVTSMHSLVSLRIAAWARSASSLLIPRRPNSSITPAAPSPLSSKPSATAPLLCASCSHKETRIPSGRCGRSFSVRPAARRWLIVAALFPATFGVLPPLAAFGVFLPVFAETFGWSRGAISTALSVNLLLGGVAGLVIGTLADRSGPRVTLVSTVLLAGIAFSLASTVTALWQLYLLVGVLGGIGMSSFYLLSTTTVTRWFSERRGFALALVLVGFNLAYITAGPLAAWLIAKVGWRAAYALLAGTCGLVTMVAALTVRLPRAGEAPSPGAVAISAPPGPNVTLAAALVAPRPWSLQFWGLFL